MNDNNNLFKKARDKYLDKTKAITNKQKKNVKVVEEKGNYQPIQRILSAELKLIRTTLRKSLSLNEVDKDTLIEK